MSVSPAQSRQANARIQTNACVNDIDINEKNLVRMFLDEFRSGPLTCSGELLKVGIFNVEHFTNVEIVELQRIMIERDI